MGLMDYLRMCYLFYKSVSEKLLTKDFMAKL